MPDIYWALNEQGRLYIPDKTPEAVTYDAEHRNAGSFYINDSGRITADAIPESVDWQPPYPMGVWYIQENKKLHAAGIPDRLYLSKPYPYSMWYFDEDLGHLFDSAIPLNITVGAFRNCTNLSYVKIPSTVQRIGPHAFENTALTLVQIPQGCTYSETSFPPSETTARSC